MGVIKRAMSEFGRALRETGQMIDRIGLRALEKPIYKEPFSRHRSIMNLYEKHPWVDTGAFVAPNATVVGRVNLPQHSSVWYGAVVRGDLNDVSIGQYTAIQDRAVIHTTKSVEGHVAAATTIGSYVVVGPGAVLHSCIIEDYAVIGAGAVVMEGALIEEHARVAEGSVVHPGRRIPAGQLWGGNPAVFVRDLSKAEIAEAEGAAKDISALADEHAYQFLPYTTAYQSAERLGVTDAAVSAINAQQAEFEAASRGSGTSPATTR